MLVLSSGNWQGSEAKLGAPVGAAVVKAPLYLFTVRILL